VGDTGGRLLQGICSGSGLRRPRGSAVPRGPERVTVQLVHNVPGPSPNSPHTASTSRGGTLRLLATSGEGEGGRPSKDRGSPAFRVPVDFAVSSVPVCGRVTGPLAMAASILRHSSSANPHSHRQGLGCQRHVAGGEAGETTAPRFPSAHRRMMPSVWPSSPAVAARAGLATSPRPPERSRDTSRRSSPSPNPDRTH
jgi:hypothetical protein